LPCRHRDRIPGQCNQHFPYFFQGIRALIGENSPTKIREEPNLQDDLDSMNDLSDMGSTELQMLMTNYSTLLQALSNIEKTIQDMEDANLQYLKS
jgi:hypothetical protein